MLEHFGLGLEYVTTTRKSYDGPEKHFSANIVARLYTPEPILLQAAPIVSDCSILGAKVAPCNNDRIPHRILISWTRFF